MKITAPRTRAAKATRALHIGGCDFAVDPDLDALSAPVFWDPAHAPAVAHLIAPLPATLAGAGPLNIPVLEQRRDESGLLWARLPDGSTLAGAVNPQDVIGLLLPVDDAWAIRLAGAERVRRVLIARTPEPPLSRQRRARIKQAMKNVDARRAGASYRDVASVYFGARRVRDEPWKTSSLKAQIARLSAYGNMMIRRGYRELLKGRPRRSGP